MKRFLDATRDHCYKKANHLFKLQEPKDALALSCSTGYLPEPVRSPDKVRCGALLRIGRKKDLLAKPRAESFDASGEVQPFN
jgi:hypothetical protein